MTFKAGQGDIEAIVEGKHADPFSILGIQQVGDRWVVRAFVPYAQSLTVLDRGSIVYSGSATDAAAEEALKVGYLGHAS